MAVEQKRAEQRLCQFVLEEPQEQHKYIFSPLLRQKKNGLEVNLTSFSIAAKRKKLNNKNKSCSFEGSRGKAGQNSKQLSSRTTFCPQRVFIHPC